METQKLWQVVLAEIELSLSKGVYQTQFAPTRLLTYEKGVATIGCSSPMLKGMIESRYYTLIKNSLDRLTQTNTSLVFVVLPKKSTLKESEAGPLFDSAPTPTPPNAGDLARRLHIRPEATFSSFAVSGTNQIAYAAATAVAKSPGTAYNPLFIYGGVGVGKTHLMQAIANELIGQNPRFRIVYSMGDEFLNEIVEAIQTKTARQFKQKYRNAQLFLVDDVQFIAGKQTAQEEFFHTFNAIQREGGQIIMTSDRSPGEITGLEDRLRSRFEGGLLVDISPPDFELRSAIVNIKAQALGLDMTPQISQLIAANISDTRALEGVLRRLLSESTTKHTPITLELTMSVLKLKPDQNNSNNTLTPSLPKKQLSPSEILAVVSDYFSIKISTLRGPKRDRPIVRARQMYMYICRTELSTTLEDVGGALGGRDHTTILHGVEVMTREMGTNENLRQALLRIKQTLWDI